MRKEGIKRKKKRRGWEKKRKSIAETERKM